MMVVLDTDHMSVLERRDQPGAMVLRALLAPLPAAEVVTTIISYEEQMRGWMAYLAQTRSVAEQVTAYRRLQQHLDNYRRIPVVGFDEGGGGLPAAPAGAPTDRHHGRKDCGHCALL